VARLHLGWIRLDKFELVFKKYFCDTFGRR
jgi:hypothetical protein